MRMMNEKTRTKRWPQYLAAITATISMAIMGSHIGWTSPVLPRLKSEDSPLPLSSSEASWTASFLLLGNLPGNIIAAFIVDSIGRKTSLLIAGIPAFLGWILILVAWSPYVLYVSRFLTGIGQGIVYVVCPMYIGEIADKKIRGQLGSFMKLMVTFGELYAHAVGPFVSNDWLAYICMVIPIVYFATFSWMPESPYYLLMRNREEKAKRSLWRLRRYKTKRYLDEDIEQIQKAIAWDLANRGKVSDLFGIKGNRRGVVISFGLQFIFQFSGIAAIEAYTQEIFEESGSGLSAGLAVILLSFLQLLSGLAAIILVDRLGRRPLLLSTTLLGGCSLTIICIFYLLKLKLMWNVDGFGWILDSSVIIYEIVMALGLSPLSYLMLGELFPTNVKGIAVSLANIWASFLAFIACKLYQVVADSFGIHVTFAWFALTCFVGVVFIVFVVPETKGKSLLQIQEELNGSLNSRRVSRKQAGQEISISTIT